MVRTFSALSQLRNSVFPHTTCAHYIKIIILVVDNNGGHRMTTILETRTTWALTTYG